MIWPWPEITRTSNWSRLRSDAFTSRRPNSMVPEHPQSALGAEGLRGFDWELWPAALRHRMRPPGARASWLAARPRLVYLAHDITTERKKIWRLRPRRTSA